MINYHNYLQCNLFIANFYDNYGYWQQMFFGFLSPCYSTQEACTHTRCTGRNTECTFKFSTHLKSKASVEKNSRLPDLWHLMSLSILVVNQANDLQEGTPFQRMQNKPLVQRRLSTMPWLLEFKYVLSWGSKFILGN